MLKVTIERINNFHHIIKNEFKENYFVVNGINSYLISDLHSILNEYQLNKQEEHEEEENILKLKLGTYEINIGDYSYYIEVEEN